MVSAKFWIDGHFTVFFFRGRIGYGWREEGKCIDNRMIDNLLWWIGSNLDARERRDTIHADHINVVKFSGATDEGYRKVFHAIKVLRGEKLDSVGQSTQVYNI